MMVCAAIALVSLAAGAAAAFLWQRQSGAEVVDLFSRHSHTLSAVLCCVDAVAPKHHVVDIRKDLEASLSRTGASEADLAFCLDSFDKWIRLARQGIRARTRIVER